MSAYSLHGPTSTATTTDWRDRAACTDAPYPDDMFPDSHPAEIAYALSFCRVCPVLFECREYALAERIQHGVWGGLTEDQRRDTQTVRARGPKTPAACGTEAGARKHRRDGEAVCGDCRSAERRERQKREEKRAARAAELEAAA